MSIGRPPVPFWNRVDKSGECWVWTGSCSRKGYGEYWDGLKVCRAHRVSWVLANGPIPDGLCVLHRCDNPPCVNPDHLFLGTHSDNAVDRERKGRGGSATGENHWTHKYPDRVIRGVDHPVHKNPSLVRGEKSPNAHLTAEKVREIRRRYTAGGISIAKLADAYQVGASTIHRAIKRVSWNEVE